MSSIQYTVRGISAELDAKLRDEAQSSGKSLNAVVVETLEDAKLAAPVVHEDLDWFIGSSAPDCDDVAAAQEWLDAVPQQLS